MKILKKALIYFVVCVITASVFNIPAFAYSEKIEIKFRPGSSIMEMNGKSIKAAEKPLLSDSAYLVPLDVIVQGFGAEVNYKEQGVINLIYRNVSLDITPGSKKCTLNQIEAELPAAPKIMGKTTMVPFRFITEKFGAVVDFNRKSNTVSAVLEDDGALKDLSFLIDSLNKPKIGNSYYGWSINIPKSSRINEISFNSKYVSIINEHRGINLEVNVEINNGKNLPEYYREINENPKDFIDSEIINDASVVASSDPTYAELIYNNSNDEAVLHRIYMNSSYIFNVILTSQNESNPQNVKDNQYYTTILDSFALGFKGNSSEIDDLSKVKFGLANYKNYSSLDNINKYFTWEVSVLPEWDLLKPVSDNPLTTKLGTKDGEYISVEVSKAGNAKDLEAYVNETKALYDTNYNPKLYSFREKSTAKISGYNALKMVYNVKIGEKSYTIDESFIKSGNLLYDITIKSPEDKYKTQKEAYYKILDTFKPTSKDTKQLEKDIDNYNYQKERNRVGKTDKLTDFQNKQYKWNIKVPGNWTRNSSFDGETTEFIDSLLGFDVTVESIENSSKTKSLADDEKFRFMNSIISRDGVIPVSNSILTDKGTQVHVYNYRWENKDEEIFADIRFYVVEREKYSYCFFTILPDIFKSDKNEQMMKEIWSSFNPEG